MRDGFVFYKNWAKALDILPPEEYKETLKAIFSYAMEDIEPDIDGFGASLFEMAKPVIDANNKRYADGKKGGRPPKKDSLEKEKSVVSENENHRLSKEKPKEKEKDKEKVKEKVKEKDKVNDKEKEKENVKGVEGEKRKRFVPPTPEQVMDYAFEKGITINAEDFIDYYASQGWKLSNGNPMKDWQAAARRWAKRSEMDRPRSGTRRGEMSAEEYLASWGLKESDIYDYTGS